MFQILRELTVDCPLSLDLVGSQVQGILRHGTPPLQCVPGQGNSAYPRRTVTPLHTPSVLPSI